MRGSPWDAAVIGAGVNGLAAAIVLARAGKRVLVLERAATVGGQAAVHEFAPGFRTAPLGLDAGWLSPAVARATGILAPARVTPERPIAVPAGDEWLVLSRNPRTAAEAIGRFSNADAGRWPSFCERVHKFAGFLAALYELPPPDIEASGLSELLPLLRAARRLRALGRADLVELLRTVPMPVEELLDEWFGSTPLKGAVGAVAVTGIRQGPRSGGTAFALLHHLAGAPAGAMGPGGAGYWRDGPGALMDSLVAQAERLGVTVRTGAPVSRILVKEDRIEGLILENGDGFSAPCVLSSADPVRTMLTFVDPVWLDPELLLAIRHVKLRGSTSAVSYALDGLPGFTELARAVGRSGGQTAPETVLSGTISLAGSLQALEQAADAAKYGRTSEPPLITLRVPSLRWPSLAPAGKHVLVAEVQWTPYRLRDGQWDEGSREALGAVVDQAIERVAPGFGALVRAREVLTPADLESRYGLTEGAPSHGELMLDQILFMRPVPALAQYATPLGGLYLCGSGSHPGPGIPGGAGRLSARRALRDLKAR